MFRYHTDTVRTPIELEKKESEVESNQRFTDGYQCDLCRACWLTETDLEIHRKKVHLNQLTDMVKKKRKDLCLICVRNQGSAEDLLIHIKTQHLLSSPIAKRVEREIFICDICEAIFFNKHVLISHIKYSHREGPMEDLELTCPKCPKKFSGKKIWFHYSLHEINLQSTCQICFQNCATVNELMEHLRTHPGYYHCDICNFSTMKEVYFNSHIDSHKKAQLQTFKGNVNKYFTPCESYTWKYRAETGLKGLQLYGIFVCVLCRHICLDIIEKRNHILEDHMFDVEIKTKPSCLCGEEFFNMVLLKHHIFKLKGNHRLLEENEVPNPGLFGVKVLFESQVEMEYEIFADNDMSAPEEVIIS